MATIPDDDADLLDKETFRHIATLGPAEKYTVVDGYPFHQPGDERVVMVVEVSHTTRIGA